MSTPDLPPLPLDPTVSVVLPARDAAATLPAAVASVLAQRLPDGWPPLDVVVAVGGSDDDTAAVARALTRDEPRVRVVHAPAPTTPVVLNTGIGASRGEVVARLDAHAVLPAGYLARAVDTLRTTGAANVGAVQRTVPAGAIGAAVAAAVASPAGTGAPAYRGGGDTAPRAVDTAYLGVFRRAALDAVGRFDERMVRNQDAELNQRLRAAGFEVWLDPALVVDHRPRPSFAALADQYRGYGRWRRATARLHPGTLAPRQLAAPALVAGLLGSVVAGFAARRPALPALAAGAYLAGLGVAAHVAVGAAPTPAPRRRDVVRALATMHLAWGVGFLQGPPAGALDGPAPRPATSHARSA